MTHTARNVLIGYYHKKNKIDNIAMLRKYKLTFVWSVRHNKEYYILVKLKVNYGRYMILLKDINIDIIPKYMYMSQLLITPVKN